MSRSGSIVLARIPTRVPFGEFSAAALAATSMSVSGPGASFTGVTAIVTLWGAEVSTPPLAVPPLSMSTRVTVAEPLTLAAGV